LLFLDSRVSAGKFNQGFADEAMVVKLTASGGRLKQAPVWVDQSELLTISEIRSRARRMQREHGIKLFVIDYMQLLLGYPGKRYRDDVERLNDISSGLRLLVKELQVPIIVLAQMNRDIEKAEASRVPVLGDLKGCGQIEQDAAQVTFLFRPGSKLQETKVDVKDGPKGATEMVNCYKLINAHYETTGENKTQWPTRIDWYVAKNRGGPTGRIEMMFHRDHVRFEDWHRWKVDNGHLSAPKGEKKGGGE
jgi:replicative DNA helicase